MIPCDDFDVNVSGDGRLTAHEKGAASPHRETAELSLDRFGRSKQALQHRAQHHSQQEAKQKRKEQSNGPSRQELFHESAKQ